MTHTRFALALAFAVAVSATPRAQRPSALAYDPLRQISLQGAVTRVEWSTPHAFLRLDVTAPGGTIERWAIDIGDPIELEQAGWNAASVRVGDVLRVSGTPARGTSRQVLATAIERGPQTLFTPKPAARAADGAIPRWPDGHPRLGPAPGQKGYWGGAPTAALFDTGDRRTPRIAFTDEGLLKNLSDIDRVAPFQPWARALYLHRQRTRLADDPYSRCLPPGGPRQFQMANGVQFVEQPEIGRVLVLHGGGDRNWRVIYTDGREQGQAAEVVQSYYGNSVGRWEQDTLVVDSIGYNERFWIANGGLPHTEALHLVERFTRASLSALRYEVTVDDPRAYTRPWTGGWTLPWVAGRDLQESFCEDNAELTFVR